MATQAHAAYCFDCLVATLDKREPRGLSDIESQWTSYVHSEQRDHAEPRTISNQSSPSAPLPLFVTWNALKNGRSVLRGCIGTFEPQQLQRGLREYAANAAFQDPRFPPITAKELPTLQVCVTLLTDFERPVSDPLDWEIGTHGLRIRFLDNGRRRSATYLPDVAKEQGWDKEEAVISLMRKAGWHGDERDWRDVEAFELVRYKGEKVSLDYSEFGAFRAWIESDGNRANGPGSDQ